MTKTINGQGRRKHFIRKKRSGRRTIGSESEKSDRATTVEVGSRVTILSTRRERGRYFSKSSENERGTDDSEEVSRRMAGG